MVYAFVIEKTTGETYGDQTTSIFLYTLPQKNISVTAGIHYISQQGLSASIKKLEGELGLTLFTRDSSGTYPNDFAIEILPHVEQLLENYNMVRKISAKNKIQISGSVEVAADMMLLDYIPHGSEARLKQLFPNLVYHIYNTDDRSAMRDILNDKAELAVVSGPVDSQVFHSTELHRFPYMAIINQDIPLYRKDSVTLLDLACYDIIMTSSKTNMQVNIKQRCRTLGIELDMKFFATDAHHLMYLCSVEPAIGITSSFYCDYFTPRNFKIVPLNEPLYWSIEIISAKNRQLSRPAVCFRDYIIDASTQMKKLFQL